MRVVAANLTIIGSLANGPWQNNFTITVTDQFGNTFTEDVAVFVIPPVATTSAPLTTMTTGKFARLRADTDVV